MTLFAKAANSGPRYRTAHNRYGTYCIPESSSHRPASQTILTGNVWEPQTLELIRAECHEGDGVHAGTFFGDFLPAISRALQRDARLWAFEPCWENYSCAMLTIEMNTLTNVTLIHGALGEKRGRARLKTRNRNGAMGGWSRISLFGQERVDVLAIDDIVLHDRNISVIQLDVEGFEKHALAGALRTIRRCSPLLILEVWEGSPLLESSWFQDSIGSLGYTTAQRIDDENVVLRRA